MRGPEPAEGPLLALETATGRGSVALLAEGEIRERALAEDRATAESLLPAVDALLREASLGLEALTGIAVSIGPGSFTGLRIGVATVKGLAFGVELAIAPVPTLAALALSADPGPGPVVALLDARRDELYAAGYTRPEEPGEAPDALPEGLYPGAELARRLPQVCRLVGDASGLACAPLREGLPPGARVQGARAARAAHVARLGAGILSAGGGCRASELVPRYVRRAQAEVLRTGQATEPPAEPSPGPGGAL